MLKPSRGNLIFLLTFLYALFAPTLILLIITLIPDLYEIIYNMSTPASVIFSQTVVILIPICLYFIVTKASIKDTIPIKKLSFKNIIYIVAISFLIQPIMSLLGLLGNTFEPNKIADTAIDLLNYNYFYALFVIALIPAVFEEILFRGVILSNYKGISVFKSALINGLFFGMFHTNMQQFFYASLLGFIFTYFIRYTKSILSVILSHFIINASNITLLASINWLYSLENIDIMEAPMETTTNNVEELTAVFLIYLAITIPLSLIVAFLMKKFIENNKSMEIEVYNSGEEIVVFENTSEMLIDDYNENKKIAKRNRCIEKYFIISIVIFLIYTWLSINQIVA